MAMKPKLIFDLPKFCARAVALLIACTVTTVAHADIFGYVDASGDTHFSTEKIDERYQLFIKGDHSFDSNELIPGPGQGSAAVKPVSTHSPLFKALTQHPNLKKYETMLASVANEYKVDPALMKAMMAAESGFNPQAVSPKGAVGLMQIMPATAERYGVAGDSKNSIQQKLADPKINVRLAARYLHDLNRLFPNQQALVIASYNAGEHAVQRYKNAIPPFAETRNYVQLVTQFYQFYAGVAAPLTRVKKTGDNAANRIHLTLPGREPFATPTTPLN